MKDRSRPVRQYTLHGEFVAEYKSVTAAAQTLGTWAGNITQCCRGSIGYDMVKGYLWQYADADNIATRLARLRFIRQYTRDGQLVAEYKSITNAHKATGVAIAGISKCCRKLRPTAGGFVWRWSDFDEFVNRR